MQDCNQCGKCCSNYGGQDLSLSDKDREHWELFRPDLLAYARGNALWFEPETGTAIKQCPWLYQDADDKRYHCSIYQDRPEDCRLYPTHIAEMQSDQCEMLELQDLRDLDKAQHKLDQLMIDSRPPLQR